MKIWILGAGGLLGCAVKEAALLANIENIVSERSVDIGDLASMDAFISKSPDVTHIVNCAAFSLVDLAETKKNEAWRTNALGPENLGIIAKKIGAKVIHISTDYVFPGEIKRPLREDDPTLPLNYYGKTKREGEIRLLQANPDACIVRTSSIFGFGGKSFVAKLLTLFGNQKEILLSNDQWVSPTYAKDLALAILEICKNFQPGIFHFANQEASTKWLFGSKMKEILERKQRPLQVESLKGVQSHYFASPCQRPLYTVFDTTKIQTTFQLQIRSWTDALEEFLS